MLGVDVGGTFTDVVAVRDGRVEVTKVPSDREHPHVPVLAGARRLGVEGSTVFNHASTTALNAVLERRLPKIGFLATEGFRDILDRGTVHRPLDGQTDPAWRRSFGDVGRPLVPRYLRRGVVERVSAAGEILVPLDEEQAVRQIELLGRCEVQGVAICLLNSYVTDEHELRLAELVTKVLGSDVKVSVSAHTSALAKEYARASTTVVDVFMKLIFGEYSATLDGGLRSLGFRGELNFADCAAALLPWDAAMRKPHRILFAGPAAGTVSSVNFGAAIGRTNLICADVGGTSTDVSLVIDGQPFLQTTYEIEHDLVINALSIEVSSVGAGGGSLVTVSPSGGMQVGPGSAGADPGPACYGKGGTQPTLTDACLLMGILSPEGFAGGELALDVQASERAFEQLDTPVPFAERVRTCYQLAVSHLSEEIMSVAVRHGVDPRDFSLVAYGSAGPMLLPAVLEDLHLREVIVPPHPGLFSALGLVSTDLVHYESRSAYVVVSPGTAGEIERVYQEMETQLRAEVGPQGDGVPVRRTLDGRLVGQNWEIPFVEVPDGPLTAAGVAELVARFHDTYEARNGNRFDHIPVEGVTYRVQMAVPSERLTWTPSATAALPSSPAPNGRCELRYLGPSPVVAEEHQRGALAPGAVVRGPAIIREPLSTTTVLGGQRAEVGPFGEILITKEDPR